MKAYQPKELYSYLFYLLMGRELSDEDYSAHFSYLDIRAYIYSLVDSPEFVERNIYPLPDQPSIPLVRSQNYPSLNSNNEVCQDIAAAVALSVDDLQTLSSGQPTSKLQFFFPILEAHINQDNTRGNALQPVDMQLLLQALKDCGGAFDVYNARNLLTAWLLRSPELMSSDLHEDARLSLELFLAPVCKTFRRYSLYYSLFTSLLGRSLTLEEYGLHFSSLSSLEYIALLLSSSECLAKNIFEILPSCTCARIHSRHQLTVQFPGALDDGTYILLSIVSTDIFILAIRLRPLASIVETGPQSESLVLSDPHYFSDALAASLIQYNSFTNEDLDSIVSHFAISTEVDVETLDSLQSGYQLPELAGVFSRASSCKVSLKTASQLAELALQHESRNGSTILLIAI